MTARTYTTKPFTPSQWRLQKMLDAADAAFEADREQAALRTEARADERAVRAAVAEVKARHYKVSP